MSGLSGAGGGRPRKPTKLKLLSGTARADRENPREPVGEPVAIPPPPEGLTESERAAWVELAALIGPMRIANASHVLAFRLMVQALGVLADARASYVAAGAVPVYEVGTKSGVQLLQRPEVGIIERFQKLGMYHVSRWGLSPADASRVSALADAPKADPLDEFGPRRHG